LRGAINANKTGKRHSDQSIAPNPTRASEAAATHRANEIPFHGFFNAQ
jgi:hypothetical protein